MAFPLWTILVATIGIIWFWKRRNAQNEYRKRLGNLKEIPGPKGLPIFGNVFQMTKIPNVQYSKWAREFGDIYKVKLGSHTMIILTDPKMAKEMLSTDPAFAGRAFDNALALYEQPHRDGLGVIGSEGERWEVHRRFLLRQLRDFGFGKSAMEGLIMEELNEVIKRYKSQEGSPIGEIRERLKLAMVNSIWSVATSKRFDQDDPKLLHLANNTSKTLDKMMDDGGILLMVPALRNLMPERSGYNNIRRVMKENEDFLLDTVNEKKRNYKDGDANDFIDVYLAEMKKAENDPKSQFYGPLAERQLVAIMFDLFQAGTDTTALTISWSILYLCKYAENQKKLQQEITEITGDTRQVSVTDRPNMPFAQALIDEIMRFSSIAADGVPHNAMADREFKGYFVPKGAHIMPNLYFIHHNPKIWGDPENFRPERFLSDDGKKYIRNDNLQPFQAGRRQCAGETLARDSVFLYLTNLFQRFDMKFNPALEKEPGIETDVGFLRNPFPYSVIMTDRLNK